MERLKAIYVVERGAGYGGSRIDIDWVAGTTAQSQTIADFGVETADQGVVLPSIKFFVYPSHPAHAQRASIRI